MVIGWFAEDSTPHGGWSAALRRNRRVSSWWALVPRRNSSKSPPAPIASSTKLGRSCECSRATARFGRRAVRAAQLYRFGGEGCVEAEGTNIATYLLCEQFDLHGHRIAYAWNTTGGWARLSKVVWNGMSESAKLEVLLTYEPRPDVQTKFSSGIRQTLGERLASLVITRGTSSSGVTSSPTRVIGIRVFQASECSVPTARRRCRRCSLSTRRCNWALPQRSSR